MSTVKGLKELFDKLEESIAEKFLKLEADSKKDNDEIKANNNANTKLIQEDVLEIRNVIIDRLKIDNRNLRERVRTLESRLVKVERTINLNNQNARKNNVEFNGIPDSIHQTKLKEKCGKYN